MIEAAVYFSSFTLLLAGNAFSERVDSSTIQGPLLKMVFVRIPAGTCVIGSADGDKNGRDNEKPAHRVNIKPFQMMTTEVTCGQWDKVMNTPSSADPDLAKGNVTCHDVMEFIGKLNILDKGKHYRLPSEAEWEYACRAGMTGDIPDDSGEYLDKIAWTQRNSGKKVQKVALRTPNAWGLYDMIGNVHEWCEDEYHDSYKSAPADGSAWISSPNPEKGVLRGGDCFMELFRCRPAARDWMFRNKNPHFTVGFRLARDD